jgi:hypothetical protein
MKNEEFEKWACKQDFIYKSGEELSRKAWNARQPEIDALKHDNLIQKETCRALGRLVAELKGEKATLQAEVERLRKDAERLDWLEAHPRLGEIHVDGEVKDCYLYAVSGALGVPLRAIIDAMKESK